jgi:hypothetical protein
MARRQPPARKIPRPKAGQWPAFFRALDKQQRHAAAEGQSRPAPSGNPPSQNDEWVHRAVAAQEARKEAADKARAERDNPPEEPTP